jgi:hypothetical protein
MKERNYKICYNLEAIRSNSYIITKKYCVYKVQIKLQFLVEAFMTYLNF